MAAAWQHNNWFWLAAAFAVAGASAQWGPQWLSVESPDVADQGRPLDIIRHPGLPHTISRTATGTPESHPANPFAPSFEISDATEPTFRGRPDSYLRLPQRPEAEASATPAGSDVRVAEYRQLPGDPHWQNVLPVDHHPADSPRSPVRLTGKIELIFDE